MNRIVLTIVLISIYCCPLLANICNNDNDPVVVIVKDEQTTGKTKTNRTPARIPIECYYLIAAEWMYHPYHFEMYQS